MMVNTDGRVEMGPLVSAIEVDNLHKSYGDLKAVDGLSFAVEEGEVFRLAGSEWGRQDHDY